MRQVADPACILVIDDEESIRDSMSLVLRKEGYLVRSAVSGQEGLNRFGAEAFQVVFVDLKLPGTTGLQVLSRIKEASPTTPAITSVMAGVIMPIMALVLSAASVS